MYNAHFLLQVLNWQAAGTPHFTTFIHGRAGKCSQALNCWMGGWRHGNTSWPYWSRWQGSHGFQPCQDFIYREQGGEEPWITTTLGKVYAPFVEKELEIKVESIPNTLSGCCLTQRCGLVRVYVLAWPALQWGSLDTAQSLGPSVFLTTPSAEDSLLIFRICLNMFSSKSDAVETGVAQLSM